MALKTMFCPMCGQETSVDDNKEFFFCPECGNKIELAKKNIETVTDVKPANDNILNERLKEAEFYYKLSFEKKEYSFMTEEPTYYLKAQDLLVELSEQYPEDYRIWWELCKPLDFMHPSGTNDQFRINEDYFHRALDRAELSKKRSLVDMYDKYKEDKENEKRLVEEAERKALEDKLRLQREAEAAKIREAEMRRQAELQRIETERLEQERLEQEEKLRQRQFAEEEERKKAEAETIRDAEQKANEIVCSELWQKLISKDYSNIENTFFSFVAETGQTIIATFENCENVLILNVFRLDVKKGVSYREQSFDIQFDKNGCILKNDGTPIIAKGFKPPNNILRIFRRTSGETFINAMPLNSNTEYIKNISLNAKKVLLSHSKVFN